MPIPTEGLPTSRQTRLQYSNLGVEDFDFAFYNKTPFCGLEMNLPNAYCNAVLQVGRGAHRCSRRVFIIVTACACACAFPGALLHRTVSRLGLGALL